MVSGIRIPMALPSANGDGELLDGADRPR